MTAVNGTDTHTTITIYMELDIFSAVEFGKNKINLLYEKIK